MICGNKKKRHCCTKTILTKTIIEAYKKNLCDSSRIKGKVFDLGVKCCDRLGMDYVNNPTNYQVNNSTNYQENKVTLTAEVVRRKMVECKKLDGCFQTYCSIDAKGKPVIDLIEVLSSFAYNLVAQGKEIYFLLTVQSLIDFDVAIMENNEPYILRFGDSCWIEYFSDNYTIDVGYVVAKHVMLL